MYSPHMLATLLLSIAAAIDVTADLSAPNDVANEPDICSDKKKDDSFMMQSRVEVARTSNLEVLVQDAVQEIASLKKAFSKRDEEFKELNEKLKQQEMKHVASLKNALSKRDEEFKELSEKLKGQEMKHEQLRQEYRLSYGMLIQVCEKGLQRYAGTSKDGANMTDVAASDKKLNPLAIAEGLANSVADKVADLPEDVGKWSLQQFNNLKSYVGLRWQDIPGLEDVVNGIKDFAEDTVNIVKDSVTVLENEFKKVENEFKKVTDYVTDLYNKYLRPIITMIWECADKAKSHIDFAVCVAKPVLEKLMETLIPAESVSEVVPFPFDDEVLQINPETGVYTLQHHCPDCVAGDVRDLAPLACVKKEQDFLSIFKVRSHVCNVPFMPGHCKGTLSTCLKNRASECAKSAMLWAPSGVLSQLSAPLEQALEIGQTTVKKITDLESAARALHQQAKALQSSSKEAVKDVLLELDSAASNARATKASVVRCLTAVGQLSATGSWSKMRNQLGEVISSVETVVSNVERTQASIETLQTSLTDSSSSTETQVQQLFAQGSSDMQTLKRDVEDLKESLLNLYQDSKGVSESLLADFQEATAAPVDQLEDLGSFMLKCATAREAYQKVYVDLEIATVIAGRLFLHERDGVQLAYIQLGKPTVRYENWTWSSFESKQGQDIELCVGFYCAKFNVKLRKNPSNILGKPIQLGGNLDFLKWFELEYKELSYDLNSIGVPFKFSDPTGMRLPSITLPFLMNTPAPAENPSSSPSDLLNTLWQQVLNNQAEAQAIDDETASAPSLPAGATSANVINSIQSEVHQEAPTPAPPASPEQYAVASVSGQSYLCGSGYDFVPKSEADCRAAARSMGFTFHEATASSGWPEGCFKYTPSSGVYFNTGISYTFNPPNHIRICKKEAPTTAPTPASATEPYAVALVSGQSYHCGSGYDFVPKSEAFCRIAAQSMGLTFHEAMASDGWPEGCFKYMPNSGVYFNTGNSYMFKANHIRICIKDAADVALGKVPTGSSDSEYGHYRDATDGDPGTVWHAGNNDYPSHLTLDLGKMHKIQSMKILTPSNSGNYGFKTLKIFLSDDLFSLFSLAQAARTDTTTDCSAGRTTVHEGFAQDTRYIMIRMENLCGGSAFAIASWEVFAVPM